MIRAHQQIGRRFRRGIGAVRRIGGRFGEESRRPQRSVHFIGGNVVEAAVFVSRFDGVRRVQPMTVRGVQQRERPQHVRFDKDFGTFNRIVDMAFGGEVNHALEVVFVKQSVDQLLVRDIALDKDIAGIPLHFRQVAFVRGVCHRVQIDNRQFGVDFQEIRNEVRTDKARSARD